MFLLRTKVLHVRSIAISVCLSVCLLTYLKNRIPNFTKFSVRVITPWLGLFLPIMKYVMFFRFSG